MELTSLLEQPTSSSAALNASRHITEDIQLSCLQNHLATLFDNSFIGLNATNADQKLSQIRKAFKYLDQVHRFISLILQIVAASKDFKIVFDFDKKLDQFLDPTQEQAKRSSLLSTKEICVPAADLLNPSLVLDVYGLLAHDLCLLALHLVYSNYCLPYYNKDDKTEKMFSKLSVFCKLNQHKENYINSVYCYPLEMQHSELVAHYVYMLVRYSKIPFKLEEIKVNFVDLSKFCEGLVAHDMKVRIHEILNNDESRPFSHQPDSSKKLWVLLIVLTLTALLVAWLGVIIIKTDVEAIYSCRNLTDELRSKIFDSTVEFQGVNVTFRDLFGRNSTACENLSLQEVTNIIKATSSFNPLLKIHEMVQNSTKFYIERLIKSLNPSSDIRSDTYYGFDELTNQKLLLLSDNSGSGKSTYFRHMAWKLKRRFPLKWISYVDLKQHIHVLQDVPKTDANLTTVVDFLSSKLFNLTSKLEIGVFERKFLSNESVFLWDGLDEVGFMDVSEEYGYLVRRKIVDRVLGFIDVILKFTNNIQWIATRTHLEDTITYKLGIKAHNFVELSEDDKTEYVDRFVKAENMEILKPLDVLKEIAEHSRKIEEILKNKTDGNKIWRNFDENLEIFQIICEFYSKNVTFGTNLNLYSIYEEYFHKILKKNYNPQKLNLIAKTHQHFALVQTFSNPVYNVINGDMDTNCRDLQIHNQSIYTDVNLIIGARVVHENQEKIIFDDKIFQDFFIAQYIFDGIWNVQNENLDQHEASNRLQFLFYVIFAGKIPYGIVTEHSLGFVRSYEIQASSGFPKLITDLMCDDNSKLLMSLALKDASDRVGLATKFFRKDSQIVDCLWRIHENRTFFYQYLAIATEVTEIIKMRKVVNDNFSSEDVQKIVTGKHQTANLVSILWHYRMNRDDFFAISKAINFTYDIKVLQNINNFKDFIGFLVQQNFSKIEIREFFFSSVSNWYDYKNSETYMELGKKLLTPEDYHELHILRISREFGTDNFY